MRNFSAGARKVSIESDATPMYIHRMKNDFILSFRFSFVEKQNEKIEKKEGKNVRKTKTAKSNLILGKRFSILFDKFCQQFRLESIRLQRYSVSILQCCAVDKSVSCARGRVEC